MPTPPAPSNPYPAANAKRNGQTSCGRFSRSRFSLSCCHIPIRGLIQRMPKNTNSGKMPSPSPVGSRLTDCQSYRISWPSNAPLAKPKPQDAQNTIQA